MTGLQDRDPISVNFFLSEYDCLTPRKVTAGFRDCYNLTLPLWIWSISWFYRFLKDPPLSKILEFQEIYEIQKGNDNFMQFQKVTEIIQLTSATVLVYRHCVVLLVLLVVLSRSQYLHCKMCFGSVTMAQYASIMPRLGYQPRHC